MTIKIVLVGAILRNWIKMLIMVVLGIGCAFLLPKAEGTIKSLSFLLSDISLNIMLYITVAYSFSKLYVGVVDIKKERLGLSKILFMFSLFTLLFLVLSAILSIFVMNILSVPQESFFDFNQKSTHQMDLYGFSDLLQNIFPDNLLNILIGGTKFFTPLIVLAIILALGTVGSGKKGTFFYDIVKSFGDILDSIANYIVDLIPFLSFFVIIYCVRYGFGEVSNLAIVLIPIVGVLIVFAVLVIVMSVFSKFFFKIDLLSYYKSVFGAALVGAVTGNSLTAVVPLNLHLKRNVKINRSIVDFLVPIGSVINQTGTIIVAIVVLLSIISGYSLSILTLGLQMSIFLFVILFSFRLDGNNDLTFLVLIAMITKHPSLYLEQSSYLLFIAIAPLFSRIAVFINVFTTGVYSILVANYIEKVELADDVDFL